MGCVHDNDICMCSVCVIVIPSYKSKETLRTVQKGCSIVQKGVTKLIEMCISVDELRARYVIKRVENTVGMLGILANTCEYLLRVF